MRKTEIIQKVRMCFKRGRQNMFLVYNEHKKGMDFEKKLSKTLAFPSQYVMIKSAKLYLAKIKKSKEGRHRRGGFGWGPEIFANAKYLFIRSCSVGP